MGLTACVLLGFAVAGASAQNPSEPISRIAFGSCAHQDRPQPIWAAVLGTRPDLFLLLGDNIYGDTNDLKELRAKYAKFGNVPGFQHLRKTCRVMATWDDHDYGKNDAGAEFELREASQQVFLDFFDVPNDSPRRQRKGVYDAQVFGPPGKRVQVIMLDTRYHRSPLKTVEGKKGYVPNTDPDATILGEEQWKWLEQQLQQPAEVRLLVSSIQVVAQDHIYEKWMNFPNERERLYKLLKDTKANGVIILSGDRHLAELSVMDAGLGYPLYDLTSSGLNMGFPNWRPLEVNQHRVATMGFGNNFGLIRIDWNAVDPLISLQIRDEVGDVMIQEKISLKTLRPAAPVDPQRVPDDGGQLPEGVISAMQALQAVGKKVEVQFRVASVGGRGPYFINSLKEYRAKENLTLFVPLEVAKQLSPEGSLSEKYTGKVIRVSGEVSVFRGAVQIRIEKPDQIRLVD